MSIPLRPPAFSVPDFRNQGVWLRVLLAANALLLLASFAGNRTPDRLPFEIASLAAWGEPALLLTLSVLFVLAPRLQRLSWPLVAALVVVLAMATGAGVDALLAGLFMQPGAGWRGALAAGLAAALLLYWLSLRARAQAPALAEARLSALTARIRPHFLYNSLNAVLGVMREEPRRAEAVLEELAELFRTLMRDNRELVPLSEEIALARKYLDIERLRLGDRLQVRWEIADVPAEMLAPPLLLQPLLENAVYHGVEMAEQPEEIHVVIRATRDGARIEIDNPCPPSGSHRHGNQMALENLRERLMLYYDLEARIEVGMAAGRYRVRVDLPRRSAP